MVYSKLNILATPKLVASAQIWAESGLKTKKKLIPGEVLLFLPLKLTFYLNTLLRAVEDVISDSSGYVRGAI